MAVILFFQCAVSHAVISILKCLQSLSLLIAQRRAQALRPFPSFSVWFAGVVKEPVPVWISLDC